MVEVQSLAQEFLHAIGAAKKKKKKKKKGFHPYTYQGVWTFSWRQLERMKSFKGLNMISFVV